MEARGKNKRVREVVGGLGVVHWQRKKWEEGRVVKETLGSLKDGEG